MYSRPNEPNLHLGVLLHRKRVVLLKAPSSSAYKLYSDLGNRRRTSQRANPAVTFHDGVHTVRGRSCATAIIEAKLEMQLAKSKAECSWVFSI
jgi:hypothetical protein